MNRGSASKQTFFSLKWRTLIVLSLVLAVMNASMAYLVYRKGTRQFDAEQASRRFAQVSEFDLVLQRAVESMATFASFIPHLSTQPDPIGYGPQQAHMSAVLAEHGLMLDVEWGVEGVHYYDDTSLNQPSVSWPKTRSAPSVRSLLEDARRDDAPQGGLVCNEHCAQLVILPLLRQGNTVGFLVIERSIGDSMKEFYLLSGADVVVLRRSGHAPNTDARIVSNWNTRVSGITREGNVMPILNALAGTAELDEVLARPQRFSVASEWYESFAMPERLSDPDTIILFINRVTGQVNAIREATKDSVVLGLSGLLLSEFVLLILLWEPMRRIQEVARLLPLLADKSFLRLRVELPVLSRGRLPRDEIDVMVDVIASVSTRIENLDKAHLAAEEALRDSEQSLQLAQSMARVASWMGRPVGGHFEIGPGARRIHPVLAHVTRWTEFLALVHPEDRRDLLKAWRSGRPGSSMNVEFRMLFDDIQIDIHAMAEFDVTEPGRVLRAVGMMQDVSEMREVQRALKANRDSLEQAVVQRTTELLAARNRAQRMAETKSQFLANMSHEIRTPLNAVLGLSQIGMQQSEHRRIATTFKQILDAGEHLLNVVNDVLDLSKLEAGKLEIEARAFDPRKVIRQCTEMLSQQARAKSLSMPVTIAADVPQRIVGDAFRLQQILLNLLSNAVKFTNQGMISLSVYHDSGDCYFKVRDSGIGISEDQLGRLFTPFQQVSGRAQTNREGTGLGLSISSMLANLMGGEISVQSSPGQGSEFTLRLPLRTVPDSHWRHGPAERLPAKGAKRLAGLHVLVADDVAINRTIVETLLKAEGARVTTAKNGREAVDAVLGGRAAGFDIVLMDIEMPEIDGRQATRKIRRAGVDLPIIGLTAHVSADERQASTAAGMHDQLVKPVMQDALVDTVLSYTIGRCAERPDTSSLH